MTNKMLDIMQGMVDESYRIGHVSEIVNWSAQVESFVVAAFGSEAASYFRTLNPSDVMTELVMKRGHLQGLIAKGRDSSTPSSNVEVRTDDLHSVSDGVSKRVFIVHGHDAGAKETVARFIEKIGLVAVILHESPNEGKGILDKLESNADVAFAVVLMTPDDVGSLASTPETPETLAPRARQNVVLELGYFIGRISSKRVCVLHHPSVELPSDYSGIVYIPYDSGSKWRTALAKELQQASIQIDIEKVL